MVCVILFMSNACRWHLAEIAGRAALVIREPHDRAKAADED
jgi:hypothetical protein